MTNKEIPKQEKEFVFLGAKGLGKKALEELEKHKAWFGVGLSSQYYSPENLRHYALWASENLSSLRLVIPDQVEKYNLMVFEELSEEEALAQASVKGDKKQEALESILADQEKIEIVRWKDFSSTPEYQRVLKHITKYYESSPEFREQVDDSLWESIGPKLRELRLQTREKEFKEKFRILVNYSLEELAAIFYFSEFQQVGIKLGHEGERVYDNIVNRLQGRTFKDAPEELIPTKDRGSIYFQVQETERGQE